MAANPCIRTPSSYAGRSHTDHSPSPHWLVVLCAGSPRIEARAGAGASAAEHDAVVCEVVEHHGGDDTAHATTLYVGAEQRFVHAARHWALYRERYSRLIVVGGGEAKVRAMRACIVRTCERELGMVVDDDAIVMLASSPNTAGNMVALRQYASAILGGGGDEDGGPRVHVTLFTNH